MRERAAKVLIDIPPLSRESAMNVKLLLALGVLASLAASPLAAARQPAAVRLASGIQGASGSTVGPGGALYVTEGATGRVLKVDPDTGDITILATGLPPAVAPIGGAIDVAFIGRTAYVLVTLVGTDVLGNPDDVVGIYRVDGPNDVRPVANIGEFSRTHPPSMMVEVPSGLQYALEVFKGDFLVTDGHHNRVLHVTRDGDVTEFLAFDNIVPTGLAVHGNTIYMAQAGPVPHLPQDGRIVSFGAKLSGVTALASGAPLLVDVEFGRGRTLYALSQGVFPILGNPAEPALPNTGALLEVNVDGSLTTIVDGLNLPTSVEFIGNTAYVITLGGEIWKIDDVSRPPFGRGK
jgi:hypothetical protein